MKWISPLGNYHHDWYNVFVNLNSKVLYISQPQLKFYGLSYPIIVFQWGAMEQWNSVKKSVKH